jgi:predicted nucleic acid-binding Zn ribbon protein
LKQPIPLGDVIHQLMHQHRPASADHLARIWAVWSAAVGDSIARHAKPSAIRGQVLVVHVTNSTWLHQLRFLKADMLAKLNLQLETDLVSDMKFKIGAL